MRYFISSLREEFNHAPQASMAILHHEVPDPGDPRKVRNRMVKEPHLVKKEH
jgi:hypothetical protein